MDWTNVFEEDGDEAFLISQQLTAMQHKPPRIARLVSILYHHQQDDDEDDDAHEANEDSSINDHRLFQLPSSSSLDALHRRLRGSRSDAPSSSHAGASTTNNSAYTLRALYYLSINYILGVGCLGIPYAFAKSGFLLCISILLVVTLSSFCTVMWVAETGERYRNFWQQKHRMRPGDNSQDGAMEQRQPHSEGSPLLSRIRSSSTSSAAAASGLVDLDVNQHHHHHQQHWDRYEVVDLVGFYLGHTHKIIYQISLMALMYIGLLAYAQVFCSAVAALLWGPTTPSMTGIPQLVFGAMVVPLSCLDLDEQISVQSFMAVVRFVAIFIMVFGSLLGLWLDDSNTTTGVNEDAYIDVQEHHSPPYWAPSEPENCQMSYTFCWSGFGVAFSTALFSQLFQHSIPGLLRPLRDKPSSIKKIPETLGASLLTTLSFYLLLGTSAASFFGASTRSSVNLNFSNFTMGLDTENTSIFLLTAVRFAANIVVIFPALDTISVFPLIANTLGNNLCAAAVGPRTIKWVARSLHMHHNLFQRIQRSMSYQNDNQRTELAASFGELPQDERKHLIAHSSRVTTLFWRLVAALPPLLGSLLAADLSFSLLLAGAAGVYVAFVAPSLMQLRSLSHTPSNANTIFQGWYSKSFLCYPVLGFATFSLLAVLVQIKEAWLEIMQT